jgi:hypothetical protein
MMSDTLLKLVGERVVTELSKNGLAGIHPSLSAQGIGSAAAVLSPFVRQEQFKSKIPLCPTTTDSETAHEVGKILAGQQWLRLAISNVFCGCLSFGLPGVDGLQPLAAIGGDARFVGSIAGMRWVHVVGNMPPRLVLGLPLRMTPADPAGRRESPQALRWPPQSSA